LPRLPLHNGAIRPRTDRPVKNGVWILAGPEVLARLGAGDLALADLNAVAEELPAGWLFLALPEPSQDWLRRRWSGTASGRGEPPLPESFERPAESDLARLADEAWFAVLDGQVCRVDRAGAASRAGHLVWVSPGYRNTRAGRRIATARVRLPAISPQQLLDALVEVTSSGGRRA
jgi:hypothetical protein